jgi:hypothetical protein
MIVRVNEERLTPDKLVFRAFYECSSACTRISSEEEEEDIASEEDEDDCHHNGDDEVLTGGDLDEAYGGYEELEAHLRAAQRKAKAAASPKKKTESGTPTSGPTCKHKLAVSLSLSGHVSC